MDIATRSSQLYVASYGYGYSSYSSSTTSPRYHVQYTFTDLGDTVRINFTITFRTNASKDQRWGTTFTFYFNVGGQITSLLFKGDKDTTRIANGSTYTVTHAMTISKNDSTSRTANVYGRNSSGDYFNFDTNKNQGDSITGLPVLEGYAWVGNSSGTPIRGQVYVGNASGVPTKAKEVYVGNSSGTPVRGKP